MEPSWTPYCGAAPLPGTLFARWNLDPPLVAGLAVATLLLLRQARGPRERRCAAAAMALLALLFVSPLCALGSALFAVRVGHHVVLTAIAAPLLVAALPRLRVPGGVAAATGVHALLFWLWHAPPAYGFALASDGGYWLMQASLFGSAILLWAALRTAPVPLAVAGLLGTMVQMGLLGALITFAGAPLYAPHYLTTAAWGLSPIEDQQLAGLVMWAPAAAIYLLAALLLGWRWLGDGPKRAAA